MKYLVICIVVIFLLNVSACTKLKHQSEIGNEQQSEKQENHPSSNKQLNNRIQKMNSPKKSNAVKTVAQPAAISVLVNKKYFLSKNYVPKDLVFPNVSFIFKEKIEKRKMRKEAAFALNKLFTGAKKNRIYLSGVSAYRSYVTQKQVFNRYVKEDGYALTLESIVHFQVQVSIKQV